MKTRARIDANGPIIAKAGYDVDTAPISEMAFSPAFAGFRLREVGVVTPAPYSGSYSFYYQRAVITYDTPFPAPPIVFFVGLPDEGLADHTCCTVVNTEFSQPRHMVQSYADRAELYVHKGSLVGAPDPVYPLRYFIFDNTIED